jgi:hypothetical protein
VPVPAPPPQKERREAIQIFAGESNPRKLTLPRTLCEQTHGQRPRRQQQKQSRRRPTHAPTKQQPTRRTTTTRTTTTKPNHKLLSATRPQPRRRDIFSVSLNQRFQRTSVTSNQAFPSNQRPSERAEFLSYHRFCRDSVLSKKRFVELSFTECVESVSRGVSAPPVPAAIRRLSTLNWPLTCRNVRRAHLRKRRFHSISSESQPEVLPSSSDQVSVSFITPQSSFNEVPNAQMRSSSARSSQHRRSSGVD